MREILIEIGPLKIPSFGVLVMIGFLVGLKVALSRAKRFGLEKEKVLDLSMWALAAGILGARLGYIIQEIPYYSKHPNELLEWQFKGMTSFGGLVLGFVPVIYFSKKWKVSILTILDCLAPGVLIGHIFGRIGCLLNGCCYGGVCELPWGIHVKEAGIWSTQLHHPAQIYDSLMNLVGLLILLQLEKTRQFRPGQAIGSAFFIYGMARFFYEFWRAGTTSTTMGGTSFTEGHVAALIVAAAGAILILRKSKQATPAPEVAVDPS